MTGTVTSLPVAEGYAPFGEYRTYYRITGDLDGGLPPLLLLHGGPGCTWDYLDTLSMFATDRRAVIHYDQIGNGRSTHRRDATTAFWSVELFLRELQNLILFLGIAPSYSILGQSWGGMLAAEYAATGPSGLKGLVLSNTPASMPIWSRESIRLRQVLPPETVATLWRSEAAGTTDTDDYVRASEMFRSRHICRVPASVGLQRMQAAMKDDPTVTLAMNGPTDFPVSGNLKDWSIIGRLGGVSVPTLIISGQYDQATPEAVAPLAEGIVGAEWRILADTSHIPHIENPPAFSAAVNAFLQAYGI